MFDPRCEMFADEARAATRIAMLVVVQQLTEEFTDLHLPADVIRQAYRVREELLAQGVCLDIVEETKAATRLRLLGSRRLVTLAG